MAHFRSLLLPLIIALMLPMGSAQASLGLGTDLVRLADRNQDDGMFNLFLQHSLTSSSALYVGYASGEDTSVLDVAWRGYNRSYHNGTYYQIGAAWYDGEDSELGVTLSLGYEWSIARNLVAGIAAKVVFVDTDKDIGLRYGEDPVFQPVVNILFAF